MYCSVFPSCEVQFCGLRSYERHKFGCAADSSQNSALGHSSGDRFLFSERYHFYSIFDGGDRGQTQDFVTTNRLSREPSIQNVLGSVPTVITILSFKI
jgi:hypothetical protein